MTIFNKSLISNLARMQLIYPNSLKFDITQLEGFGVDLKQYDASKPIPDDLVDAEAMVAWGNSPDNLKDAHKRMGKLKWIQSLAAGPNDLLNAGFDPKKITITTGSGLHDYTVTEHALTMLLSAARRFHEMRDYQLEGKWPGHLGGPQPDRPAGSFRTLRDANILIWGFGNIARTLTPHLTALGAKVRGVARHAGIRDGIEIFTDDKIDQLLPETDALVMILPGSEATRHALNAQRLKLLPKHAWVINIGRGTSIDEDALAKALEQGTIGGAALDVFDKEPLPENSPLWKQSKNLILSPHAAGGRPQGAEELVASNLRRFLAKQPMKNVL